MAVLLPDYSELDQFEFENVKYSILGRYKVGDFIHHFVDGEFGGRCAFVFVSSNPNADRPSKLVFWNTVVENLGHIFSCWNVWNYVAVYERMTPIKLPEQRCGNCKHFVKHYDYASEDSDISLKVCLTGGCPLPANKRNRKRYVSDKPYSDNCFEWNAECQMLIEQLTMKRGKE